MRHKSGAKTVLTDLYEIAIIGSGPAGISAAARAADQKISHILIEKTDHLSDTIFKYQKGKHIMATPDQLVLRSNIDFEAGSREDILQIWHDQAESGAINVLYEEDVFLLIFIIFEYAKIGSGPR